MKKIFLPTALILFSFIFFSCKKADSNTSVASTSYWTLGEVTYSSKTVAYKSSSLVTGDATGNSIQIYFKKAPPTTGTYNVTPHFLNDNECSFLVKLSNSQSYIIEADNSQTIDVVADSGKITATFNNIIIQSSTTNDIQMVSGVLTGQ